MLNVGPPELLVILVVALVVLGPERLPGAARQVGRAVGELRRLSSGFQQELREAMDDVDPRRDGTGDFPVWSGPAGADAGTPTSEAPRPRRSRPLRAE